MPVAQQDAEDRRDLQLRLAWVGRVSTAEQQDPTLSLPRQLANATAALPDGWVIVAHFYDIESGRLELAQRGRDTAPQELVVPIARDGGLDELLAEACSPTRRFDAVICESVDRIARRTAAATRIEHDLEQAGVALFASDEPFSAVGRRSTSVLTRRVKQAIAEWFVLHLLEQSWDGLCEHTRQGWNIGRPPYGYLGQPITHPVPARRAQGMTKTRLVPDPLRAPVVAQIYAWRVAERLAYRMIADRLNTDPRRYPPPTPPEVAHPTPGWTASSVRGVLTNPKYTGHMVWNRRATKHGGTVNPPQTWVWSPAPTHPAIVPRSLFDQATSVARERAGSRGGAGPNRAHPHTKRSYLLRGLVWCGRCGRRMSGKTRRGLTYYTCQHPNPPRQPKPSESASRLLPRSVWVREQALLPGLTDWIATHAFGADQRGRLAEDLAAEATDLQRAEHTHQQALHQALHDNRARHARLLALLEARDDPDGTVFDHVRSRLADLDRQHQAILDEQNASQPASASADTAALLENLPVSADELADLDPGVLRRLLEAFRVRISYDRTTNQAHCQIHPSKRNAANLIAADL